MANNGPVDSTGFAPKLEDDYRFSLNRAYSLALAAVRSEFYQIVQTQTETIDAECPINTLKLECAYSQPANTY